MQRSGQQGRNRSSSPRSLLTRRRMHLTCPRPCQRSWPHDLRIHQRNLPTTAHQSLLLRRPFGFPFPACCVTRLVMVLEMREATVPSLSSSVAFRTLRYEISGHDINFTISASDKQILGSRALCGKQIPSSRAPWNRRGRFRALRRSVIKYHPQANQIRMYRNVRPSYTPPLRPRHPYHPHHPHHPVCPQDRPSRRRRRLEPLLHPRADGLQVGVDLACEV